MSEPILKEYRKGRREWTLNGKLHREDGPAFEWRNGYKEYKEWWLNGKLHREDGPAVERVDGSKEWWLNNQQYTEEEYVMIQFMNGVDVYAY